MIRKLTFFVGLGAGYVLGAKAGEQRYQEIVTKAREIAGMPAVQEAASTITSTAATAADKVTDKVTEKASSVLGGKEEIDLTGSKNGAPSTTASTSTSGSKTTARAPMAGAAASGSAPDATTR